MLGWASLGWVICRHLARIHDRLPQCGVIHWRVRNSVCAHARTVTTVWVGGSVRVEDQCANPQLGVRIRRIVSGDRLRDLRPCSIPWSTPVTTTAVPDSERAVGYSIGLSIRAAAAAAAARAPLRGSGRRSSSSAWSRSRQTSAASAPAPCPCDADSGGGSVHG